MILEDQGGVGGVGVSVLTDEQTESYCIRKLSPATVCKSYILGKLTDLPRGLFANPVWHALQTKHRHFAISAGDACRYHADVAPFAAVAAPSPRALQQLHSLLAPAESVWLTGDRCPEVPELLFEESLGCLQMVLPETITPPAPCTSGQRPCCQPHLGASAESSTSRTSLLVARRRRK
jgi:hypothetical protein